jgi:LPXTG-motif cell wall-anchored protein
MGPGLEKNSITKEVSLNFAGQTTSGNGTGIMIVVIVIVVVVGYYFWRKRKKKKHHQQKGITSV